MLKLNFNLPRADHFFLFLLRDIQCSQWSFTRIELMENEAKLNYLEMIENVSMIILCIRRINGPKSNEIRNWQCFPFVCPFFFLAAFSLVSSLFMFALIVHSFGCIFYSSCIRLQTICFFFVARWIVEWTGKSEYECEWE